MKIQDVPRNNIDAALKFYEDNKPITPGEYRMLMKLQDDPAKLIKALKDSEIEEDWRKI